MEKQQFKINIHAPKEKVWKVLWNMDSYKKWTSVFSEGSTVETDNWKKGSKVRFGDGKGEWMVAKIKDNIPNEFMSIQHLGMVKDGVEDLESDKVKSWAGAEENYTLKGNNGNTELIVDMDMTDEYKDYFINTWPKALEKVKDLAEH